MTKRRNGSRRRGVGSITSYETKAGTRWRYQLWVPADPDQPDGAGKHVGKAGFATAEDADDALQDARAQHRAGRNLAATVPTVREYSKDWIDALDLAPATIAGYRRILDLHVNPAIGDLKLDKVTATRLARLYKTLGQPDVSRKRATSGLSANSIHKVHVAVGAMLDAAREDSLIASNPARRRKTVKAPTSRAIKRGQAEMVTWSGSQLGAFLRWDLDIYEDDMHSFWWTIAHTGMRRSEALALRWQDIDLEHARIQVRRALDTATKGAVKTTKSGRARVVDIDPATVKVLRAWRKTRGSLSLDLATSGAIVFGTLSGDLRNAVSVSEMFGLRVTKAQATLGRDAVPTITLHGLRHTHASVLLEAGENPKVVQERLGHTTITTTMDTYAHVSPTMQRAAAERFAAALGGA